MGGIIHHGPAVGGALQGRLIRRPGHEHHGDFFDEGKPTGALEGGPAFGDLDRNNLAEPIGLRVVRDSQKCLFILIPACDGGAKAGFHQIDRAADT